MSRVFFSNPRGLKLVGDFEGEEGPAAVILCHGMLSSRESTKIAYLSEQLRAANMPHLRFDFSGRGESEGGPNDITYSGQMEDLQAAIDYLLARGVARVGLFGSSMGGAVALLAAAREERVVAIGTIAAVAYPAEVEERYPVDTHRWRKEGSIELGGQLIGVSFLDDALTHDVVSAVRVIRAPLWVVHGVEDATVPVSDAHDIAAAARAASLNLVDGADHRFSNALHMRPAMKSIAEFLVRELCVTSRS